jgi:hypothetical protein
MTHPTPRETADRQARAYNARDLDAFCALHAEDVTLIDLPSGRVVASSRAAMRPIYAERFSHPGLYARIHAKTDIGDYAIDRETIFGIPGAPVDIVAIYEVREGLIRSVRFIREPTPLPTV